MHELTEGLHVMEVVADDFVAIELGSTPNSKPLQVMTKTWQIYYKGVSAKTSIEMQIRLSLEQLRSHL